MGDVYIQNVNRKPEGKMSVQRHGHGWDVNIKMDINFICAEV